MTDKNKSYFHLKMKEAKFLLKRAIRLQSELSQTNLANELIDRSTPILWFGNVSPNNWVTIATNPSSKEFLETDKSLLLGNKARFYVRENGVTLEEYEKNDAQLESTIEMYNSYFERNTTYRGWFGKKNGAKLEGFLNGMGGSLYSSPNNKRVVHTDFFPLSTRSQMSRIRDKDDLLESDFTKELLKDILEFLQPSKILVLGKEHCQRFQYLEPGIYFDSPKSINHFPDAKYQIGFHSRLNAPVIGLHFKPSEQFIGLGGGTDENCKSHGDYARKDSLNAIGNEIMKELQKVFPITKADY